MDVDDAKILEEAKAILKEITDPCPDPKKKQIEIWEAWFDRMADGGQLNYRTPEISALDCGDTPYLIFADLRGSNSLKSVPQGPYLSR